METFFQDIRYGFRVLRASPGFAAVAVLSLALGIGANTSIFSVVNAALLRPLPVAEPDRLIFVFNGTRSMGTASIQTFSITGTRTRSSPIFSLFRDAVTLALKDRIDLRLDCRALLQRSWPAAALSLTFNREGRHKPHPVAVISHNLWQQRYGGDQQVIGQQLALNGQAFTIVGVTPAGFNGPDVLENNDIYVPTMMQAVVRPPRGGFSGDMNPDLLSRRGGRWMKMIGRLKPGVSFEQAQAAMTTIAAGLEQAYPETNRNTVATLFPVSKVDP
jgi:hypothetical protein